MPVFWENKETILAAIEAGTNAVRVNLAAPAGIWFFQALLQKARQGVPVEITVLEPVFRQLEVNPAYFENLVSAGGKWFKYPSVGNHPRMQSFILSDLLVLLFESVHPTRQGQLEITDDPGLIEAGHQYFLMLKERGLTTATVHAENSRINPYRAERPLPGSGAALSKNGIPIRIRLEASARAVDPGEAFELSWDVDGADSVAIEPLVGGVPPKGSRILRLSSETEFRLVAANKGEEQSRVLRVEVDKKPKINYRLTTLDFVTGGEMTLDAREDFPDHFGIIQGQAITLYWEVLNAESVEIDGIGTVEPSGFKVLTPEKLTAYTILARGNGTLSKKIAVVNVFPMPTLEKIQSVLPQNMEIRSVLEFNNIPMPAWLSQPMDLEWNSSDDQATPKKLLPPAHQPATGWWRTLMQYVKRKKM